MRKSITTIVIGTAAATMLSACDRPAAPPPPEPEPTPTASPASILREDVVAPEEVVEVAEPLNVVVPFADGGVELDDAAQQAIDKIVASDLFADGGKITLRGHTDSAGYDEANLRASRRRAEAVADALEEAGADPERFEIIPLGEMRPVAPNANLDGSENEQGRARNRRVDVHIALSDDQTDAPTLDETEAVVDDSQ